MIHNDGDVLVPLAVAGFVDANADKTVEALAGVWFEILVHTMDAAADSVPLDAHVRGNSALAQLQRHPRDHHVERLGEVGMGERPWNAGSMNAVLWAADTRQAVAQVDDDAMVVHSSSHARLGLCMVIAGAAIPTDWETCCSLLYGRRSMTIYFVPSGRSYRLTSSTTEWLTSQKILAKVEAEITCTTSF